MIEMLKENLTDEDMEILIEADFNFQADDYDESNDDGWNALATKCKELNLVFSYVDNYGGEGQGEDYWYVFKVVNGCTEKLFRLDGWYQSFHGRDFDDLLGFYEVVPKEKTIIVYEAP